VRWGRAPRPGDGGGARDAQDQGGHRLKTKRGGGRGGGGGGGQKGYARWTLTERGGAAGSLAGATATQDSSNAGAGQLAQEHASLVSVCTAIFAFVVLCAYLAELCCIYRV